MTVYLFDYENAGGKQFNILEHAQPEDQVVIFYSENCKKVTLSFETLAIIKKLKLDLIKVVTRTKEALDLQLATYLGYLIAKKSQPAEKYLILSQDRGFESLANFWQARGIEVLVGQQVLAEHQQETEILTLLEAELPLLENEYATIIKILNQVNSKSELHNSLNKILDNQKVKKIYPLLREFI